MTLPSRQGRPKAQVWFRMSLTAGIVFLFWHLCSMVLVPETNPMRLAIEPSLEEFAMATDPPIDLEPSTGLPATVAIVAASLAHDNTSWLQDSFPDWQHNIYVMDDDTASLTVEMNRGNEGSAYLSYIISHYHDLPDFIIFIHGPRYQWHNEDPMYDHIPVLKDLSLDHVEEVGYASLRCTWQPGCPVNLRPDRSKEDGLFGYEAAYAEAWDHFWPGRPVPSQVGAPCCAQFAVSKAQVLQEPIWQYEKMRKWLWRQDHNSGKSGRIMEYMWHVIFGQPPVLCPDARQCFCNKFSLCNIDCRHRGACENRFWQPWPMPTLPARWPEEGQGSNGWPVDLWWMDDRMPAQAPAPAPPPAPAESEPMADSGLQM